MNMCSSEEKRMFKILCFHGYRQSGDTFRKKIGALRKILKGHAEFVFITAPNEVPSTHSVNGCGDTEVDQYGWWFSSEDKTFTSKKPSDDCIGFARSMELVKKTFEEEGPFDGLLGFSQGASFVSILCSMQGTHEMEHKFSFAIMIAGFKSLCMPHVHYYRDKCDIPSLHVFGETDEVIDKEMSEALQQQFKNSEVIVHSGGHFVPASSEQKKAYIAFMDKQRKELNQS